MLAGGLCLGDYLWPPLGREHLARHLGHLAVDLVDKSRHVDVGNGGRVGHSLGSCRAAACQGHPAHRGFRISREKPPPDRK